MNHCALKGVESQSQTLFWGIRLGRRKSLDATTALDFKRQAAAVIGVIGAVGAFGGVLIQVVLRQASLEVSALVKAAQTPAEKVSVAAAHADWSVSALWVFFASYIVFAGVTWFVYLRTSFATRRVPSLAEASV